MKILAVDDERGSLFVLTTMLKKLGHEPLEAKNGKEACELFESEGPDMVITDWQMPEMDGVELSRRIREVSSSQYTYIVLLTALEGKENLSRAIEAGADDYVTKPFDQAVLGARIHVAQRIIALETQVRQLSATDSQPETSERPCVK
jgi:DNA-binding response OmpR family regulator